jgi:hypothetical protein
MNFLLSTASVPILELIQPIIQDTSKVLSLEVTLPGRETKKSAP